MTFTPVISRLSGGKLVNGIDVSSSNSFAGRPLVPPPLLSTWTQINFDGLTIAADVPDGILLSRVGNPVPPAAITPNVRLLVRAIPVVPYEVILHLRLLQMTLSPGGSFPFMSGAVRFAATGGFFTNSMFWYGSGLTRAWNNACDLYTSPTVYGGSLLGARQSQFNGSLWMRLRELGFASRQTLDVSIDGYQWDEIYGVGSGTIPGDQAGICLDPQGANVSMILDSWEVSP